MGSLGHSPTPPVARSFKTCERASSPLGKSRADSTSAHPPSHDTCRFLKARDSCRNGRRELSFITPSSTIALLSASAVSFRPFVPNRSFFERDGNVGVQLGESDERLENGYR